jgi:hypothetical protein
MEDVYGGAWDDTEITKSSVSWPSKFRSYYHGSCSVL